MSKIITNIKINWFLLLVILTGVLLRLWKLAELFHFTYDEEIFAFVGKRMFINGHMPLIGGVTPMHVHVAPYFYWLSGIILFISKLNPLGWGIFAAIIAGMTMFVLYLLGKEMFGKWTAIIATTLYAFSFYQNIFDRHYWGLVFDGLLSLSVIYCLFKIKQGKIKFIYPLAASLGFGIHTDLSMLVLVILSVAVLIIYKIKVPQKHQLIGISIFLISFLPLLIFDIRHDWVNLKGINQYRQEIVSGKTGVISNTIFDSALFIPRAFSRLIWIFGDTDLAKQYAYCPQYAQGRLRSVPDILSIIILLIIIWFIFSGENNNSGKGILKILLISVYSGILVYGIFFKGDLFDHYLATLYPVFFIILAYMLNKLFINKKILYLVIVIFITINLYQLINAHHTYGYADKTNAVKWSISTVGKTDFSLDVIGDCYRYNGYRYLYLLNGKEPVKSYVDTNFSYLYDTQPAKKHPQYLAVLTNPSDFESYKYYQEYSGYLEKTIARSKFGAIEVFIIDNSNLDFVGKF